MNMTVEEITLIKKSWKLIRSLDPILVADVFYSKLFSMNPPLRKMFPEDMDGQYRKLMNMLNTLVARLEDEEGTAKMIDEMAGRHIGYGVRPAHYRQVGNALLWTLAKGLGPDAGAATIEAWRKWYEGLAERMMNQA